MKKGFTLIETIVYLALFTLIIGGLFVAAYALIESVGRNQTKAIVQEEKGFLVGKIHNVLNAARSASVSGPILVVYEYGSPVQVCVSGMDLRILRNSGDCLISGSILNTEYVAITDAVFLHAYAGGLNPERLEVGFTISAKTPNGMSISEHASTTGYIRK